MKLLITISCILYFFCGILFGQNRGIPGLDYNSKISSSIIQEASSDEILTTLSWESLSPSPQAVSRSCCAFISFGGNDYIYQFGGGSGAQYTTVVRYVVATNTWESGFASIPTNMSGATAVTVGDKIYLFGGESAGGLGKTYMYDPVANSWTAKANMLTLVTDALVVKFEDGDNYIYVVGGGDGLFGTTLYSSVQLYDVSANNYTACTSLPAPVTMMGGGMLNYTIIVAGGWTGSGGNSTTYKGVVNPGDMTQITWTTVGAYPAGGATRMASFPVTFGTYPSAAGIFCTGGSIDGAAVTNLTYLYNYCTEQWETLSPNLGTARSNFKGCGKMDNVVYVIAGYNDASGIGTSDKATLTDIAGNCYTPVPVELTSFNASVNEGNVVLNWQTATETNNQGFEIQRNSGNGFQTIGFVQGNGTSTQVHNYSFVDKSVAAGNHTYRLRQVDFDGTSSYSITAEVTVEVPKVFSLEQNYPNPFNPSTQITFNLAVDSKVTLKVLNILGQEVATLLNGNMIAGAHFVNFNAAGLSSGVYIYRFEANGANGNNFTSVKKMILTK